MSVKIIKEGQTKFITKCPRCGCEFEYELDDLSYGNVKCPCCGDDVLHKFFTDGSYIDVAISDSKLEPITYNECAGCAYYETLKKNPEKAYITGDSPCTWCMKRKVTCTYSKE